MNNTMIDTKAVILSLQRVKKERRLSIDKIYKIVESKDPSSAVSRTTIARVFRKGAENLIFKWENTLRPIANALLDLEEIESYDNTETTAYKSILMLKKDIIGELEDRIKVFEDMNTESSHYLKTIKLLETQIAYKDKRIDQLLDANDRLQNTVDKLTQQLLTCPCRQKGEIVS